MSINTRLSKLTKAAETITVGRQILCDDTEDNPGAQPGHYAVTIDGQLQPGFFTKTELLEKFNITQADQIIFITEAPYTPP